MERNSLKAMNSELIKSYVNLKGRFCQHIYHVRKCVILIILFYFYLCGLQLSFQGRVV
jgi:hypothetical protein